MESEDLELDDYGTVDINLEKKEGEITEDYPNLSIKIEQAQYSIYEIKRRYDRKQICIDPEFQRNDVWNIRQKSELIESVIMGIPLPLIYLAENADGKLIVVDGRQRLSTFFQFLDNEFHLRDLKILKHINGMKFRDMEEHSQYSRYITILEDTQLIVQIIKYPTKDRVRFDIFDRVNRGGTPLNKQEMRNALYQGKATVLLKELSQFPSFLEATGKAISPKRMKDRYIILRALCFYLYWHGEMIEPSGKKEEYRSDMEEFLGNGMILFNSISDERIKEIKDMFDDTMKRASECLGEDGFRLPSHTTIRNPISMTLFETLFYYYTLFPQNYNINKIREGIYELLEDKNYLESLQNSIDSSVNVKKRFEKVQEKYKEITHAG